jgi:hypothetical protein
MASFMSLPVEIHDHILSHLDDTPALACMALVSKDISVLATPHLYSSVTLFALETLLARPDLCAMVKKAEIHLQPNDWALYFSEGYPITRPLPPLPSRAQIERLGLDRDFVEDYSVGDPDALAVVLLHLLPTAETLCFTDWGPWQQHLPACFPVLGHGPPIVPAALRSVTSLVVLYEDSAVDEMGGLGVEDVLRMLALPALKRLFVRSFSDEDSGYDGYHLLRQRIKTMYGTSRVEKLEFHNSAIAPEHLAQIVQIPHCLRHFHYGHGNASFSYDDGWIVRALEPVRESLWTLVVTDEDDDHENALAPGALGSLDGFTNLRYSQFDAKFYPDEDDTE